MAPHVALTRLFGGFDLVGALDAIGAPGHQVLMYRPPNRIVAAALRVITPNQWFCADDDLWVCHDGEHLLFAHNSPIATELVGA